MNKLLILIILFVCLCKVSYCQIDLQNGLVVYYPFNGNANDVGIHGFNGTVSGNVTLTTDRFGNPNSAYDFGGTNADFIEVAHNALLNFSDQSFSISLWAYRPNPPYPYAFNAMLISKGIDIEDGYSIRVNADGEGNAGFRLGNPTWWQYSKDDIRSPRDIGDNIWTHYVGTYDNNSRFMNFYEDGTLVAQKIMLFYYEETNMLPLTFGQHSASSRPSNATALYPFRGKIDDIRIYNRVLSACEANALSNDLDTCYTLGDNLIARYEFCGNSIDLSGFNNNGTVTGGGLIQNRYGKDFSAYSLSGVNSGMDITELSSFDFDTGSFGLSVWIKTISTAGSQRIMSKGDLNSSNGYYLGINKNAPGSISFGIGANGNSSESVEISTLNSFADGQWHLVVASANRIAEKLFIFVDGEKQAIVKSPGTAGTIVGIELFTKGEDNLNASSPDKFVFGKYSDNTENFIGSLDDIWLYNRPLYSADANNLFYRPWQGEICCPFVPVPVAQVFSVCGKGSLAISASGAYGYEWYNKSVGGILLATTTSLNVSNIVRDSVFFVTGVMTANCKSTRIPVFVVITSPSAPIIPDQAMCGPGSMTLSATGTGLIKWYSASIAGTLLGSGSTLFIPYQSVTGNYFVSNTKDGCESLRDSLSVSVWPVPSITGINGPVSVCPTATSIGYGVFSVPGHTYQWSVTGGVFIGTQVGDTVAITWGASTPNGKVRVQPANQYGCIGNVFVMNIVVNSLLGIGTIPIGDSIICLANAKSRPYYVNPSNGSTYTWTVVNGTQLTPNSFIINVDANTTPGLMKLTVLETVTTSSNVVCKGQSDTLRVMIYNSPDSTIAIQGPPNVCKVGNSVFSLNGFVNSTYKWSVTNGIIISGQGNNSITSNFTLVGNALVNVQETSVKGCKGKIFTTTITTGEPFVTRLSAGADTVCTKFGINQIYSVSGFAGSSYEWTSDNVNWTPIPDWTISSTAYILTTPGTGFIKVKEIPVSVNACPHKKDSLFVNVFQSPTDTLITGRIRFCENTLNEPYSFMGLPNSTFSWWVQSTFVRSGKNTNQVNIDFKIPGSYKITVLERSAQGCYGDSVVSRKFVQVDPKPKAKIIIGDSIPCVTQLDSVEFYINGFLASGYHWDISGENATIIKGQGTDNIQVKLDSNLWRTRYWVKVVETSGPDCIGDTVRKFVRIDRPLADIRSVSVSEANEKTIELNYAPADHDAGFLRASAGIATVPFHSVQYLDNNLRPDSIIYQYQLIEKDKCGNVYSSSIQENMLLKGTVDSTYGSVKLSWNPYIGWAEGVKEYQAWRMIGEGSVYEKLGTVADSTMGSFVVGADGPDQIFIIKAIGNDPTRIGESNPVKLLFNDVPKVYSGFTPNGDGKNDTWIVDRLNLYPDNKVTIMDKWGTPIYKKSNYLGEWDGTVNGKEVSEGIYYYVIDLGRGHKSLTGIVTVIR